VILPPLQPGDVLAFWGEGWMSRLISWGTLPQYGWRPAPSHVALVIHAPDRGPVIFESTTLRASPCLVHERPVRGCQFHTVSQILREPGRARVLRLAPDWTLTPEESLKLWASADLKVRAGIDYDVLGAVRSGRLFAFRRLFPAAALETLFCSELVASHLQLVDRFPLENPSRHSPARLVRTLLDIGLYRWHDVSQHSGRAA
jgi:hypothetical protein